MCVCLDPSESATGLYDLRFGEADLEVVIALAVTDLPLSVTAVSVTSQSTRVVVLHKLNE